MGADMESLKRRFWRSGMQLHKIARKFGCRIIPGMHPSLPKFGQMALPRQEMSVEALENLCSVYNTMVYEGQDIRSSLSVIWGAFRVLGLVPPSNLFDKIQSDDIIEIYGFNGLQMFANLRFYEICSYTLEDIYSLTWEELWQRDENATKSISAVVDNVEHSSEKLAVSVADCAYVARERHSPFKLEIDYRAVAIAPLWNKMTGLKAGFIIVERAHLINEPTAKEEEALLAQFYKNLESTDILS